MVAHMIIFLLGITAITTLILNILLTRYLFKSRSSAQTSDLNSCKVTNFVLTPNSQNETEMETKLLNTEILDTEIITSGGK